MDIKSTKVPSKQHLLLLRASLLLSVILSRDQCVIRQVILQNTLWKTLNTSFRGWGWLFHPWLPACTLDLQHLLGFSKKGTTTSKDVITTKLWTPLQIQIQGRGREKKKELMNSLEEEFFLWRNSFNGRCPNQGIYLRTQGNK